MSSLPLTDISPPGSTKLVLGWTPVPGAIGYRFQSAGNAPKWSHTWDPNRSQVTFAKGQEPYLVEALGVEAAGQWPTVAPPAEPAPIAGQGYREVFRDDFDTFNPQNWSLGLWYENPKPILGDDITVQNSILRLTSKRAKGNPDVTISSILHDGTGRSWTYGYFEARMKWSNVPGSWPAFWVHALSDRMGTGNSDPMHQSAEYDIFEGYINYPGMGPKRYSGTLHKNTSGRWGVPDQTRAVRADTPDLTAGFHTYAGLWTPQTVSFYLNDQQLGQPQPVFDSTHQPLFLIFDIWREREVASPPADLWLEVDYVTVWQKP